MSRVTKRAMRFARALILLAGLLGIPAFFLPIDAGDSITAYDALRGVNHAAHAVSHAHLPDVPLDTKSRLSTHDAQRDTSLLLRILSLFTLLVLLPSLALVVIALGGVEDPAFGSLYAIVAVLAAGANLYLAWPLHAFGSGKVLLLVSSALGVSGGVRALLVGARTDKVARPVAAS